MIHAGRVARTVRGPSDAAGGPYIPCNDDFLEEFP
jgi:hypothetical protein